MPTIKQINKANPEKYLMVSYEFGAPVYIAPLENLEIQIADKKEEAEVFSYADTLSAIKLAFHKTVTGLNGLKWEVIQTDKCFTVNCKNPVSVLVTKKFGDHTSFKCCDRCKPNIETRPEWAKKLPFCYTVTAL